MSSLFESHINGLYLFCIQSFYLIFIISLHNIFCDNTLNICIFQCTCLCVYVCVSIYNIYIYKYTDLQSGAMSFDFLIIENNLHSDLHIIGAQKNICIK